MVVQGIRGYMSLLCWKWLVFSSRRAFWLDGVWLCRANAHTLRLLLLLVVVLMLLLLDCS